MATQFDALRLRIPRELRVLCSEGSVRRVQLAEDNSDTSDADVVHMELASDDEQEEDERGKQSKPKRNRRKQKKSRVKGRGNSSEDHSVEETGDDVLEASVPKGWQTTRKRKRGATTLKDTSGAVALKEKSDCVEVPQELAVKRQKCGVDRERVSASVPVHVVDGSDDALVADREDQVSAPAPWTA